MSDPRPLPGAFAAHPSTPHPHAGRVRFTLCLRTAQGLDAEALLAQAALPPAQRAYLAHPEMVQRHGAAPEDLAAVRAFAEAQGLTVVEANQVLRKVVLEGEAGDLAQAFGFTWHRVEAALGTHAVPMGDFHLPPQLEGRVVNVLGLDAKPRLRPHVQHPMADTLALPGSPTAGTSGAELARRYGFPAGDGAGLRVGVLELGGGFTQGDLDAFFQSQGQTVAPVRVVAVDGGKNDPTGSPLPERFEVALDLQVLGSVLPGAAITAYFAPNTDQGFMDALQAALHDPEGPPSVLSVSWGSAEGAWAPLDFIFFDDVMKQAAAQGVTVVCSSGDFGSRDGLSDGKAHVNYPASSAWALAVGGTSWPKEAAEGAEVVWNSAPEPGATGGGVSDVTDLPVWQQGAGVPPSVNDQKVRRGVPDVAAVADMATGYRLLLDGQWWVVGGTSAAAPLWAGLVARCQAALGAPCGFLNPLLYGRARPGLRPITQGDNGDYRATSAYSACTGLGVPMGESLLEGLSRSIV